MTSSGDEASSSYPPPQLTAYIEIKAIEILMTEDLTEVVKLIKNIQKEPEGSYSSSKLLYHSFTLQFPDSIAIKLSKIYRKKYVRATIKSFSLELLDSLLEDSLVRLKNESLTEIKTLLNPCLWLQKTSARDFKLLSSIISRVSIDMIYVYIACISDYEIKKPLLMFIDLPMVLEENILITLLGNELHLYIIKGLLKRNHNDEEEDWCLYLEAGFKITFQLVNSRRDVLVYDLIYAIQKSIWEMISVKRREIVVYKGLVKLLKRVRREALRFSEDEYEAVTRLVSMIQSIDGVELMKMALNLILETLDKYYLRRRGFVRSERVRLFTRSASLNSRFRVL